MTGMRWFRTILLLFAMTLAAPAAAVKPDEILKDAKLEARARAISKEIRCLVCRNESIDESNADLARDLRLLVRERLEAGDNDAAVRAYLVARYGQYVLLKPSFSLGNLTLWLAGPVLFLFGLAAAILFVRGRRPSVPDALSDAEKAELDRILKS